MGGKEGREGRARACRLLHKVVVPVGCCAFRLLDSGVISEKEGREDWARSSGSGTKSYSNY